MHLLSLTMIKQLQNIALEAFDLRKQQQNREIIKPSTLVDWIT